MMSMEKVESGMQRFPLAGPDEPPDVGACLRALWADVDVGWTPERAERIFGNIQAALERRRRHRRLARLCLAAAAPLALLAAARWI